MVININCPKCIEPYMFSGDKSGSKSKCRICEYEINVPPISKNKDNAKIQKKIAYFSIFIACFIFGAVVNDKLEWSHTNTLEQKIRDLNDNIARSPLTEEMPFRHRTTISMHRLKGRFAGA